MANENPVEKSFGGNTTSSSSSGTIKQDPGVINIDPARIAANGNGPMIITHLYGYVGPMAAGHSCFMRLGTSASGSDTDPFTPAQAVNAAPTPPGGTGWKNSTNWFISNGKSGVAFGYYDLGAWGFTAGRSSSGGNVSYNGTDRAGVLGGKYRYIQSPKQPVLNTPVVSAFNHVAVSWSEPDDGGSSIDGYRLQYSKNATFPSDVTTTTVNLGPTVLSWEADLDYGTTYYFRLAATNDVTNQAGTTSVYSVSKTAVTQGLPTPTALTATAMPAADTELLIGWTADTTGVDQFRLEYKKSSLSTWTAIIVASTEIDYTLTGLSPNTIYDFRIRAETTGGLYSSYATTTASTSPSAPSGLAVVSQTSSQVFLDWDDDTTGITSYSVKYKKSSDSTWTNTGYSGMTSSYTVSGLLANTSYQFSAFSVNSATGKTSAAATVTTSTNPSGPPVRTSSTTWTNSSLYVCETNGSWVSVPNGSMYVWDGTQWKGVG